MSFTTAIKTCFRKYASFRGRAPRSEFWFFTLFWFGVCFAAIILDTMLGWSGEEAGAGPLYALAAIGLFLPSISVAVRRLHDTDRSGWRYWLVLFPLIGFIFLLVWFCQPGTAGENQYGEETI
ncbi:DUF805 domain-containing protein [Sphingomonas xinjiangensis]|uniref:Uncharacterized membrane protein YhaH (DUF805 family) n=1 Tax=Sphingomonas xinjiangensis TaxID=643568 RepID=A0A840YBL3_9SPHN|nr:DUF805 domain-containing protein [Sphingomonas xinjiangensis]MBB5709685.1 uncharacterized membrane protein YhaH (DUF805 family) [Sphingomonas xinjiangensis]